MVPITALVPSRPDASGVVMPQIKPPRANVLGTLAAALPAAAGIAAAVAVQSPAAAIAGAIVGAIAAFSPGPKASRVMPGGSAPISASRSSSS